MYKDIKFLNNIVLIPIFSTIFLLIFAISIYTSINIKEGNEYIKKYQDKLLKSRKNSLKDRVNFVISCIENKNRDIEEKIKKNKLSEKEIKELYYKTQKDIKDTINNFKFRFKIT